MNPRLRRVRMDIRWESRWKSRWDMSINTGIDNDSKSLGAYYILGALTLVNTNAAISLPWLYQSVNYI